MNHFWIYAKLVYYGGDTHIKRSMEKHRKNKDDLHMVFIDFEKTYDGVCCHLG